MLQAWVEVTVNAVLGINLCWGMFVLCIQSLPLPLANWVSVTLSFAFLLAVHVFTHVIDDRPHGFKKLLRLNPVNLHTTTWQFGLVVLTFISSGAATSIVWTRHGRTLVNGRKKQTHQAYGKYLIFDFWKSCWRMVGVVVLIVEE